MGFIEENKRSLELVAKHFSGYQIWSEVLWSEVFSYLWSKSMTKFDVPTRSAFWFIWKNSFDHLSKPIHNVILIPFVVFYFEPEKVGKEGEEIRKLEYL